MFHIIYALFSLYIILSFSHCSNIITIPLKEKQNPFLQEDNLFFNITTNYSVYLRSDGIFSILSIEPFLWQFPPENPPVPIWKNTYLSSTDNKTKITISQYSIELFLFETNIKTEIEFEQPNIKTTSYKGDYLQFGRKNLIVKQLFNDNIIPNNSFAFELYSNNNTNEYLYLGGIPHNKLNKLFTIEPSLKETIDPVLHIGKYSYSASTTYSWYSICEKNIIVDNETFFDLINDLFSSYINRNQCEIIITEEKHVLYCYKDVVNRMTPLKMFFIYDGRAKIELKWEMLFSCYNDNTKCMCNLSGRKSGIKNWKIGYSLLKDYIVLFDNENDVISFYSKDIPLTQYILKIIKFICFIIIIGILNSISVFIILNNNFIFHVNKSYYFI